ncbi:MAG: prepilin peptidase [Chloroflexi bacterium]|nr:MAG: prepilin peptidase [Chloroflexota bacterium]
MIYFLFALVGLLAGGVINVLADDLPRRVRPQRPHCGQCGYVYAPSGWLAIGRWLWGDRVCPECGARMRWRAVGVELTTAVLFAILPLIITHPLTQAVYALYMAVLILIIVIDLEHRLILDMITLPGTLFAIAISYLLPPQENTMRLALAGAIAGFLIFYLIYWIAQFFYGAGALGLGDVKLALLMGAMLGFHRIFFALMLAIMLGGVVSLLLLLTRRINRHTYLPYGQYLAVAAIIMLLWGVQVYNWYIQ